MWKRKGIEKEQSGEPLHAEQKSYIVTVLINQSIKLLVFQLNQLKVVISNLCMSACTSVFGSAVEPYVRIEFGTTFT